MVSEWWGFALVAPGLPLPEIIPRIFPGVVVSGLDQFQLLQIRCISHEVNQDPPGDAGIVQVIIQSVFKVTHQNFFQPVELAGQSSEFLCVFCYGAMPLSHHFYVFSGLLIIQGVFESPSQDYHGMVEVL